MLINKNEVKASEGEEEDGVKLIGDVESNKIAVIPSRTENDCRKNVKEQLPTSSERLNTVPTAIVAIFRSAKTWATMAVGTV